MGNYSPSGPVLVRLLRAAAPLVPVLTLAACATTPPPPPAPPPAPLAQAAPPPATPVAEPLSLPAESVRADAPLTYVVKPGDTLWSIANRFLLDPWQWPEVWYVNGQVQNPHRIYPGDVLKLVNVRGRPQLVTEDRVAGGTAKLSPQVRELPLDAAVPMIPIDAIRDFLRGPRLVTRDELSASPYLLAFVDDNLVGGASMGVYVKNLEPKPYYSYSLVRRGRVYKDPDNGELLGYEAIPVGEAEVQAYGKPSTAILSRTYREALIGDRLLPVETQAFNENFYPRAPAQAVDGRIIAVTDGMSQIGQYQIVTLNRGSDHGLEPGHVLDIMQSGRKADDPYHAGRVTLPDAYAGKLIVFKVTPRVSFALVMSVVRPVHELDRVEKPVRGRG